MDSEYSPSQAEWPAMGKKYIYMTQRCSSHCQSILMWAPRWSSIELQGPKVDQGLLRITLLPRVPCRWHSLALWQLSTHPFWSRGSWLSRFSIWIRFGTKCMCTCEFLLKLGKLVKLTPPKTCFCNFCCIIRFCNRSYFNNAQYN